MKAVSDSIICQDGEGYRFLPNFLMISAPLQSQPAF